MNDAAREVLIRAALSGRKQIKGRLHDGHGGACAMGLFYEDMTGVCKETAWDYGFDIEEQVIKTFDLTGVEVTDIIRRNNVDEWDFLTIARKVGANHTINEEPTHV